MSLSKAFDLTGRVALVTGASSYGIGSVSAKVLAEAGASVFLVARREDELAKQCDDIRANGGKAGFFACDVADESSCKAAVEACIGEFGRLDIMVLSAGISGAYTPNVSDEFDTENWRKVQGINLDGCWWMMKYGHEECAKGGVGSIILMSSLAAIIAEGSAAYAATKGALRSLTIHFGRAMATKNVRVNSIYPGWVDSDMTNATKRPPEVQKPMLAKIPMGRIGDPHDIAYGVLYLACDASSFMTGQHLVIDGGQSVSGYRAAVD